MEPKISLIICAHDEEKYLGACLDAAIKNSAGKFFEIVVVDNASTDHTTEVAQSRTSVRVVSEPNKGLTKARQRGFIEARGEILAYIDADTLLPPGWVDNVIKEFRRDSKLAALSGPYVYFDVSKFQQFTVALYWRFFAYPIYLLVGYMLVGGNFAIRKDVVQKMGGFDTRIDFYGEDTDVARRASQYGKAKFSLKQSMLTSGRRFEGQGLMYTNIVYMMNFVSEVFLHRPVTKNYTDIR